jgi:hypothetical protein
LRRFSVPFSPSIGRLARASPAGLRACNAAQFATAPDLYEDGSADGLGAFLLVSADRAFDAAVTDPVPRGR